MAKESNNTGVSQPLPVNSGLDDLTVLQNTPKESLAAAEHNLQVTTQNTSLDVNTFSNSHYGGHGQQGKLANQTTIIQVEGEEGQLPFNSFQSDPYHIDYIKEFSAADKSSVPESFGLQDRAIDLTQQIEIPEQSSRLILDSGSVAVPPEKEIQNQEVIYSKAILQGAEESKQIDPDLVTQEDLFSFENSKPLLPPSLSVSDTTGAEDSAISLDISMVDQVVYGPIRYF